MRVIALAALALAACQPAVQEAATPAAPVAPAAEAPAPAPLALKPAGPPRVIPAESETTDAAWVTDVRHIKDANAKVFSTAGGDPAINGFYTYLAQYDEDERGWKQVYMIGDFNSWEVVEESSDRFVLKVSRSWVEQGSGDIKTVDEHLIVALPAPGATTLEVTPAA